MPRPKRSTNTTSSQKRQLSQSSQSSQRSKVTKRTQDSESDSDGEQESGADINTLANELVRLVVIKAGDNIPLKRQDIKKVIPINKDFNKTIERADNILREYYGYSLKVIDTSQASVKNAYIVCNRLKHIQWKNDSTTPIEETNINQSTTEHSPNKYPEDVDSVLLLLILSHIFMSNNSVTHESLCTFLRSLKIELDEVHDVFGNIVNCIKKFKSQKYLETITDATGKVCYSWGARSEAEVSKHEVLKFVCKIYKNQKPQFWENQYQAAREQELPQMETVQFQNNLNDSDDLDD